MSDDPIFTDEQVEERISQATLIVRMVNELRAEGVALWHNPDGNGYITIPVKGHREHWPIRSKRIRDWLSEVYYRNTKNVPGSQALHDASTTLEGLALHDGPEHRTHLRIAQFHDVMYLDLCNSDWQAVEITENGWSVVSNPLVKFRRARAMLPLPVPTRGGSIQLLWRFITGSVECFILIVSWIIGAFRASGPYPILETSGEQGSGKSTLCRLLRRLIDPNEADLRSHPREEHDLVIAAKNGWVIGLDNLSAIPVWLSDALCRIATGGGFGTRELYSDSDEIIFNSQRPIVVNGITELATRADLLDRCIRVTLPTISEQHRKPESELWAEFNELHPQILGALLDVVCTALRRESTTRLDRLPRMADFAKWIVAAESSLPWKPGEFMAAYKNNRNSANEAALEALPVVGTLIRWWEKRNGESWSGTAAELLAELDRFEPVAAGSKRPNDWPKNARGLSGVLRRLAPNLRAVGVEVRFTDTRTNRGRIITIGTPLQTTVTTDTTFTDPVLDGENAGIDGSGSDGRSDDPADADTAPSPDAGLFDAENPACDGSDDRDGVFPDCSNSDLFDPPDNDDSGTAWARA